MEMDRNIGIWGKQAWMKSLFAKLYGKTKAIKSSEVLPIFHWQPSVVQNETSTVIDKCVHALMLKC